MRRDYRRSRSSRDAELRHSPTNGELLARGPEMFVGYLDASLDAGSFAADGWFRTGDLARFDGDYLTIVDAEGHHHPRRREHVGARGRSCW
jgi:cyclohexanecarboxylate-CoA ligase